MRTATTELRSFIEVTFAGRYLRKGLAAMGVPQQRVPAAAAAISRARKGSPLSWEAENELRGYLGMPMLEPEKGEVALCIDCGKPHGARRCYGKEVVDVVVINPGQQVVSQVPAGYLLDLASGTAEAVLCRSEPRRCINCGTLFVPRSWNQRRCQPGCRTVKQSMEVI